MDAASQNKTERINLRVKSSAKDLIVLAASFEGKTVSPFILTSALKCAEKTVQEHQMMTLNANDLKAFFEALSAISRPGRIPNATSVVFLLRNSPATPKNPRGIAA